MNSVRALPLSVRQVAEVLLMNEITPKVDRTRVDPPHSPLKCDIAWTQQEALETINDSVQQCFSTPPFWQHAS